MIQKRITDYYGNYKSKKQKRITDYFSKKVIRGYNPKTDCWHCLSCGENMGKHNPRQLCRKTYCENSF
jgi:hypothetical protein